MGIYKRGGVYWARKQVGNREHRRSLETADRRLALSRHEEWKARLGAAAWGERPPRTFVEAVEKFITDHCAALKPKSALRYGVSLKALAPIFEGLTLDQVDKARLGEFETLRRAQGVTAGSIRRDLACLSSLMTSAEDWDWLPEGSNPVPGYMRKRAKRGLKEAPPRTRYLTEGEERALLAEAAPHVRRAAIVAIDTGLRVDEQFSLTWPQVDFKRGLIALTDWRRLKGGRGRTVPLPPRAAAALAELATQRHVGKVPTLYVFRHDTGERLVTMKNGLAGAAERAGITNLRWHDLRRTAGCRWLQRDRRAMHEVQYLLGHSSVKVTETTYAFLNIEELAADVAARSPAFIVATAEAT